MKQIISHISLNLVYLSVSLFCRRNYVQGNSVLNTKETEKVPYNFSRNDIII